MAILNFEGFIPKQIESAPTCDCQISFAVDYDLKKRLQEIALSEHSTLSAMIRDLVKKAVAEYDMREENE